MYLDNLRKDDVYVNTAIKRLNLLTGMPNRKGLEKAVISNGKIVNVVSENYGHLTNQDFFGKAESLLKQEGLNYERHSINRDDRSFVVDFIITDTESLTVHQGQDKILPLLRFVNSYDGRERTSGHFGFYREVCSNGLHIAKADIHFSIRHTKNCSKLVLPKLRSLLTTFLKNDYYELSGKFSSMAEIQLLDTAEFVKDILEITNLFKYESSDKNPEPSKRARKVIEIIDNESLITATPPSLWSGYNAFNQVLHNELKKGFGQQRKLDMEIFESVYAYGFEK